MLIHYEKSTKKRRKEFVDKVKRLDWLQVFTSRVFYFCVKVIENRVEQIVFFRSLKSCNTGSSKLPLKKIKISVKEIRKQAEKEANGKQPDSQLAEIEPIKRSKSHELSEMLAEHRGERHIVAIQNFPDPDAISSSLAHQLIANEFGITTDIVYDGFISHQENLAMVRLLDIDLLRYDERTDLTIYKHSIFIDNQGTTTTLTAKLREAGVKPLIIVDHHERQGLIEASFTDLRKVGATATIYTEYMREGLLTLDKSNPQHVRLATALMHGLRSETLGLVRAKGADFLAAAFLSSFVDQSLLSEILNVKRTRRAIDIIKVALENRIIRHNYSIAGVGFLRYEDRDAVPQAADFLLTEENIHTAVVYGIVTKEGEREVIVGSLRTTKVTLNPDTFLKNSFGKDWQGNYYGGGKYEAGGFEIPIGFLSGFYDEEFMKMKWRIYDSQVKRRILEEIGVEDVDQQTAIGDND